MMQFLAASSASLDDLQLIQLIYLDIYAFMLTRTVCFLRIVPELQFKFTQASGGTPDGGSRRSRPVS